MIEFKLWLEFEEVTRVARDKENDNPTKKESGNDLRPLPLHLN